VHSNSQFDVSNIDWNDFKAYVFKKYAKSWARTVYSYARKYAELVDNPSVVETFSGSKKNSVLKSLVALSKFYGFYPEFKQRIEDYGIKYSRISSIDSFFRIFNNNNKDILVWYQKATSVLDDDCSTYLKFLLMSGLRPSEGIESFNLVRTRLEEYYNVEFGTLEHFRFKDMFLRNTKNVFITIVPEALIQEIAEKEKVTSPMVTKKLQRNGLRIRLNNLRDYYATFMVRNGLIKEEVDLLQGRIGKSIFVRHYWSPAIKELKQRVLKALKELESNILS
jgi:intergrase/recombinase